MTLFKKGLSVFGALVVLGTLTVATLNVTTQTTQTATVGSLTVTSTGVVKTLTATTLNATSSIITPSLTATSSAATTFTLASGKALAFMSSATSSIDAAAVTNGTCAALGTISVPGAQASSTSPASVMVGYDPVLKSGYATHTQITGYVSSYGVVTIEGCAGTTTAMMDPPALVYRASVFNFNP